MSKKLLSVIAAGAIVLSMSACNDTKTETKKVEPKKEAAALSTAAQKVGYSIGLQVGMQVAKTKDMIDADALTLGLKDALAGTAPKMTPQESQAAMMEFQKAAQEKMMKEAAAAGSENVKAGEAFLAANKAKEGVVTLPSGLQYKVVKAGSGATPSASDTVVTHYRGTLIDGKVFDSSIDRGEPATFPVGGVIAGWTEALQLMKVGGKWELYIPSKLAYGPRGAGQMIGPDSTLLFEIELLEIKK